MPGVYLLWVEAPQIASGADPGQFVMVRTSEGYDPLLRRPFSIHRVGGNGALALLFEVVGRGTNWMARRKKGDVIDLLGPLGHGFALSAESHDLLLVAGGIGIAPLLALSDEGIRRGLRLKLLLGAPTQAQLYPSRLLPPEIEIVVATEDGSAGKKGTVTELLAGVAQEADQIFACGPISMYKAMAAVVNGVGQKSVQVSMEARMGCGFGGCYGCAIETKRGLKLVCKDGPVFELSDLIW